MAAEEEKLGSQSMGQSAETGCDQPAGDEVVDEKKLCEEKLKVKTTPVVSVFGAGITGLTVAQELAERGFDVQVLEPTASLDRDGECEIGGVARTQYSHIPPPPLEGGQLRSGARISDFAHQIDREEEIAALAAGTEVPRYERTLRADPVLGLPQIIYFESGGAYEPSLSLYELVAGTDKDIFTTHNGTLSNEYKLKEVAQTLIDAWHVFGRCRSLECRPPCDPDRKARAEEKEDTLSLKATSEPPPPQPPLPPPPPLPPEPVEPCAEEECLPDCVRECSLRVEIIGHTDDLKTPQRARVQGLDFANEIKKVLVERIKEFEKVEKVDDPCWIRPADYVGPDAIECDLDEGEKSNGWDCILQVDSEGLSRPAGSNNKDSSRILNNRVEFRIREVRLPGEHGYRFYPSFYRHLDDTLSRIPIYEKGLPTRDRVLDNLAPVVETGVAYEDRRPAVPLVRRQIRSFEEIRQRLETLQERLGLPLRDVLLFQLKVFKYMTSSGDRRREAEDVSWWDYLEGHRYSESLQRQLKQLPFALAAVSVTDADARTTGNIGVQFLLDQLGDGSRVDRTMNAPTSEAWFRHWKDYLKRQGVRFYVGRIEGLKVEAHGQLEPVLIGMRNGRKKGNDPIPELIYPDDIAEYGSCARPWKPDDFRVLALPADVAKELLQSISDDELVDDRNPTARTLLTLKHYDVGVVSSELPPQGSMRDMIGVQLYFDHDLKFVRGYNYYADSDWGLTSISQLQFWQERRARHHGYMGVLSVDVGNAHRFDVSGVRAESFHANTAATKAKRASDLLLERYGAWRPALDVARNIRDAPSAIRANEAARRSVDSADVLVRELKDHPEKVLRQIRDRAEIAKGLRSCECFFRRVVRCLESVVPKGLERFKAEFPELFKKPEPPKPPDREREDLGRMTRTEGSSPWTDDKVTDLLSKIEVPPNPKQLNEVFIHAIVSVVEGLAALLEAWGAETVVARLTAQRDQDLHVPLSKDEQTLYLRIGVQAILAGARTFLAGMECLRSKTAWNSTKRDLALTVWRQIRMSIDPVLEEALLAPSFYHVDDFVVFCRQPPGHKDHKESDDDCKCGCALLPSYNKGRYQVNLVGEFERRPGPRPVDPADFPPHGSDDLESVRELPLYDVFQDRWVVAGTFMKTYTRLATMEAANESARHAVNAILHRLVTTDPHLEKGPRYQGAGRLMGDFCKVWNLEDNELDDLAFLKRLDARLHAEDLPHLVDILHLEDLTEQVAYGPGDPRAPLNRIPQLLEKLTRTVEKDWSKTREATVDLASFDRLLDLLPKGADTLNLQSLFAPLQRMWSQIEQLLLAAGSPPRRSPDRRPRS